MASTLGSHRSLKCFAITESKLLNLVKEGKDTVFQFQQFDFMGLLKKGIRLFGLLARLVRFL